MAGSGWRVVESGEIFAVVGAVRVPGVVKSGCQGLG